MQPGVFTKSDAEADASPFDWGSIQWVASAERGNARHTTVGRVTIRKGFSNPPHSHATCEEVLHLLRGRLEHVVGDQMVVLGPGDTLVIPAGVIHSARSVGDDDAQMIVAYPAGHRDFVPARKER